MLLLEIAKELLGDALNIKRRPYAACDLNETDIPFFIELRYIEYHLTEFTNEQITRLTLYIKMVAWIGFAVLALDPVPETLRVVMIKKHQ